MFDLSVKKEKFPYKYYSAINGFLKSGGILTEDSIGVISEAGIYDNWGDNDYAEFIQNVDAIPNCRVGDDGFNMLKYVDFYCSQDGNVLIEGFMKFRGEMLRKYKEDIINYLTLSSFTEGLIKKYVYYPNGNIYQLSRIVREFCQLSIRGGRCMTANNKSWHVTKPVIDFDANSLYPSSITRAYVVEGPPEVIPPFELNYSLLKHAASTAFMVEIEITAVNKHYAFPLTSYYEAGPGGKVLNWDDKNISGRKMVVNDITLEDLIEFQGIEFNIIRGYKWCGKKDYRICELVHDLFNTRKVLKAQKPKPNPLHNVYKYILNNIYGKTIQKPITSEIKFIQGLEATKKYCARNYVKFQNYTPLADCDIGSEEYKNAIFRVEVKKFGGNFSNNC
jgi:hypothetical protein